LTGTVYAYAGGDPVMAKDLSGLDPNGPDYAGYGQYGVVPVSIGPLPPPGIGPAPYSGPTMGPATSSLHQQIGQWLENVITGAVDALSPPHASPDMQLDIIYPFECPFDLEGGGPLYRGGSDLTPRNFDIAVDKQTGLLKTTRGISLNADPSKLARFGGAYRVISIPDELKIEQIGSPGHYEITPTYPMTMEKYRELLQQVVLELLP
jgi:hypothetical protein